MPCLKTEENGCLCENCKRMVFHIAQKLNMVLGLNEQEQVWLESLGAVFEEEPDE